MASITTKYGKKIVIGDDTTCSLFSTLPKFDRSTAKKQNQFFDQLYF